MTTCGAPPQNAEVPVSINTTTESVVQGRVLNGTAPVGGAFVRLLDSTGEFTAEVVSSDQGDFRFFAAPGSWTIRALSRQGNGQSNVEVESAGVLAVDVAVA